MKIVAKAPAKLILLGEYAVLYGNTGISTALDIWTTVTITRTAAAQFVVDLADLNTCVAVPLGQVADCLQRDKECLPMTFTLRERDQVALKAVWSLMVDIVGTDPAVKSDIPTGKGLGSSGAFCVSLTAALLCFRDGSDQLDLDEVRHLALQGETMIHGKTSGIDVEISTFGGTRAFSNGQSTRITNPLDCYRLLLVDTGVPRQARQFISKAKAVMSEWTPAERQAILEPLEGHIEKLIQDHTWCISSGILEAFQTFLADRLQVSHPAIDGLVQVAKERFGLAAKMTGAGGGGFAFVLLPRSLPTYWLRRWQLGVALKQDTRTQPYSYTFTGLHTTSKGVHVSLVP